LFALTNDALALAGIYRSKQTQNSTNSIMTTAEQCIVALVRKENGTHSTFRVHPERMTTLAYDPWGKRAAVVRFAKKLKAMIGAVFVVVVHEDMFPSNGYLHSFAIDLAYDISSLPFVLDAAVKTGFVPADDSFARGSSKSDKTDLADAVDEWDIVDYYNPEMLATFKKEMKKGKRGSDPFCLFHGDRGKYVFP